MRLHLARGHSVPIAIAVVVLAGLVAVPALGVGTARSRITSNLHNSDHADITNSVVTAGTSIHIVVNLAPSRTSPLPTGTLDINRYATNNCTGAPVATEAGVVIVAGSAESGAYISTAETVSLRAHYDGDAIYRAADGPCVVATAGSGGPGLTIDTAIHDPGHSNITGTTLSPDSVVHVQATIASGTGTPTGSIELKFWSGTTACPGHADSTQKRLMLVDGVVESLPYTLTSSGGYSFKVVYRGDSVNPQTVGPCVFVIVS